MTCGTGIGTIDPDWPHFKAMDAILSKQGQRRTEENALEGPRCEDIKQEIEIDINDDMESWATNDSIHGSETNEEPPPAMPSLQPAPLSKLLKPKQLETNKSTVQTKAISTIIPNVTIPTQNFQLGSNTVKPPTGAVPSYPLPLLILNGLQTGQADKNKLASQAAAGANNAAINKENHQELCNVLKDLLDTQRQSLDVEKQRLELEKQKVEFDRAVGSQLLTLVPIVGAILQRLAFASNQDLLNAAEEINCSSIFKNGRKRAAGGGNLDILKDSKILRTVLEQGIKKYMMDDDETEENDDHENETNSEEEKYESEMSKKAIRKVEAKRTEEKKEETKSNEEQQ
ncbi:uncharacterized protein LOC108735856 isoform X2 [Agrilus planipennis]|nr:uncharacterized protein LOC108735856 isoform X2 [Agrilus planipennis]